MQSKIIILTQLRRNLKYFADTGYLPLFQKLIFGIGDNSIALRKYKIKGEIISNKIKKELKLIFLGTLEIGQLFEVNESRYKEFLLNSNITKSVKKTAINANK